MTLRSLKKPVEGTIPTRNHLLTTSGSGHQNPVAPDDMESYESTCIAVAAFIARCEEAASSSPQEATASTGKIQKVDKTELQAQPVMTQIKKIQKMDTTGLQAQPVMTASNRINHCQGI